MNDELHIASFIVHARPEAAAAIDAAVAALPVAEVAAREGGRFVVLIESEERSGVTAAIDCLRDVHGVLAVNLVYHHAEPRASLLEETPHARDPA